MSVAVDRPRGRARRLPDPGCVAHPFAKTNRASDPFARGRACAARPCPGMSLFGAACASLTDPARRANDFQLSPSRPQEADLPKCGWNPTARQPVIRLLLGGAGPRCKNTMSAGSLQFRENSFAE